MSGLVQAPSAVTDEKLVENQAEEGGSGGSGPPAAPDTSRGPPHPAAMAELVHARARVDL